MGAESQPSVIVVGAGPIGCTVAFALIAEGFHVQILDEGSEFGGIWRIRGRGPIYKGLETNLPPRVMGFQGKPFIAPNPSGSPFAQKEAVTAYVKEYCEPLRGHVAWGKRVTKATRDQVRKKWIIDCGSTTYESDYLVAASGHFAIPRWPRCIDSSTKEVIHSRDFYDPSDFAGQKVLVVGNSSSGADAAGLMAVIAPQNAKTVIMACSSEAATDKVLAEEAQVELRPALVAYMNGTAKFADGSEETGIESVVCCTGYLHEFDYLEELDRAYGNTLICPRRAGVQNLLGRIFWAPEPSLAVVGNDTQIVPFPYGESQGAVIARVWSGRLKAEDTPGTSEDYTAPLGFPRDYEYMRDLNRWARSAGLDGAPVPADWDEEQQELRRESGKLKVRELSRKISLSRKVADTAAAE